MHHWQLVPSMSRGLLSLVPWGLLFPGCCWVWCVVVVVVVVHSAALNYILHSLYLLLSFLGFIYFQSFVGFDSFVTAVCLFVVDVSTCLTHPQVIAIAMDVFTDIDIFKEVITATLRGVAVYILLDESQFGSFLTMSRRAGINIQDLKVRNAVKHHVCVCSRANSF